MAGHVCKIPFLQRIRGRSRCVQPQRPQEFSPEETTTAASWTFCSSAAKNPRRSTPTTAGQPENASKRLGNSAEIHSPLNKERRQQTFIVSRLLYNAGNNDHSHLAEVPFFGFGKNCFALDYADFTLKHLGSIRPQERLLTKSYGELCLQAGEWTQPPHNDLPASLNKRLGTALMNNGNYTFGTSPTALTPATCSTLDRSETFASKRNKTKFYTHAGSPPRVSRSVSLSHPEQREWPCCTGTKPNAAFFAQNDGKPSSAGTRSGSEPM